MNTTFKDVSKRKEIHAIEVFCHMIKYFRDCMMTEVNFMGYDDEEESEIMWVLTVPAIWSDPAKQVLTEAAKRVCFIHFFKLSVNELSCFLLSGTLFFSIFF